MGDKLLRFAGFELDQQRGELRGADGVAIRLRPKTFEMLRLFATSGGRVLTKQALMEAVWPNVHVGEDSLFQCIRELRTALGDEHRQLIKLASGGGYSLTAEVLAEQVAAAAVVTEHPVADPVQAGPAPPTEAASVTPPHIVIGSRKRALVAAATGLCAIILAVAAAVPLWKPELLFRRAPPRVAVMPIVDAGNDPRGAMMAAEVTGRLTDGFAKIQNISVVALRPSAVAGADKAGASVTSPDYEVRGELQRNDQSWTLRARHQGGHRRGSVGRCRIGQRGRSGRAATTVASRRRRRSCACTAPQRRAGAERAVRPRAWGVGRRRQGRDRAGHRVDQPDHTRALRHGAEHAAKGAR